MLTAYRVIKAKFAVFGFQTLVERYACKLTRTILRNSSSQTFCWIDDWYDMTLEDVQKYEEEQNRLAIATVHSSQPAVSPDGDSPSIDSDSSNISAEHSQKQSAEGKPRIVSEDTQLLEGEKPIVKND